jgi:uncharacterized membrane protein
MKWYHAFFKRIFKGIILFLLPLVLFVFVLKKAVDVVQILIAPVKKHLPAERVFGIGMITLISIILILLVCYLAGILVEKRSVKGFIAKIENNILIFIPGYSLLRAQTSDALHEEGNKWEAILLADGDDMKVGIVVDRQQNGYCTVFFPEPPDARQGEMKLMHESKFKKLDIPVSSLVRMIRRYGQGSASLVKEEK